MAARRVVSQSKTARRVDIRIGYACINTVLGAQGVTSGRTCRLETASLRGLDYLRELALQNIADIMPVLRWNLEHDIHFFRLTSDIFPHAANPRLLEGRCRSQGWKPVHRSDPSGKWVWRLRPGEKGESTTMHKHPGSGLAYSLDFAREALGEVGRFARANGIRLTMHPKQMNQLGAHSRKVLDDTISDLVMHGLILDMLDPGMRDPAGCVMVLHGGGAYGDKAGTLARWSRAFRRLPLFVRRRIVLENDERIYTVDDLLPVCNRLRIPLVFDTFHHELNPGRDKHGQLRVGRAEPDFLDDVIRTWQGRGHLRMKLHISQQCTESRHCGSHSAYVTWFPPWLLKLATREPYDLMVEAKMKDQAALLLREKMRNSHNKKLVIR